LLVIVNITGLPSDSKALATIFHAALENALEKVTVVPAVVTLADPVLAFDGVVPPPLFPNLVLIINCPPVQVKRMQCNPTHR
jgi:hypothetical protein